MHHMQINHQNHHIVRPKYLYVGLLLLMAVGLILLRGFVTTSDALHEPYLVTVVRATLDININAIGVLDAARTHMVSSAIGGDRAKIIYLIEDGAIVIKDDVLVRFDPTPFDVELQRIDSELKSLEATVESAEQMLAWEKNQAESSIRTAEFNIKVAELELRRLTAGDGPLQLSQYKRELDQAAEEHQRYNAYIEDLKRLEDQGFSNPNEMKLSQEKAEELSKTHESARQRYASYKEHVLPTLIETARAKLDKARIEKEQIKKGTGFKVAHSQAALKELLGKIQSTRVLYERALADMKRTTIRAPFGGIVVLYETFRDGQKRKPNVGDIVWQNQPILYLPDISVMIVNTQIREVDLHKVTLEQSCSVQVDAYPNRIIAGKITNIGALAINNFGSGGTEKYFHLTITLMGENSYLRPGMTARIATETDTTKPVLLVPLHAVFNEEYEYYCYLSQHGGYYFKKQVTIGRQNEDFIEITSGLEEGDRISVIRPPKGRISAVQHIGSEL